MHLHAEIWNNRWSAPEYNLKDVKSTNASVVRLQRLIIQSLYFSTDQDPRNLFSISKKRVIVDVFFCKNRLFSL